MPRATYQNKLTVEHLDGVYELTLRRIPASELLPLFELQEQMESKPDQAFRASLDFIEQTVEEIDCVDSPSDLDLQEMAAVAVAVQRFLVEGMEMTGSGSPSN